MPTYVYQEILPDGSDGETFEYIQRMSEVPIKAHPKTGNPVRKVYHSPNVSSQYTEGATKSKLTDANVEKHGFTRYEKDKVTGRYNSKPEQARTLRNNTDYSAFVVSELAPAKQPTSPSKLGHYATTPITLLS